MELLDQLGEEIVIGVAQQTEGGDPAAERAQRTQCVAATVGGRNRLLGERQQLRAGGGQRQPAATPAEQGDAVVVLDPPDQLRHGGLGHRQFARRGREGASPRGTAERSELGQ